MFEKRVTKSGEERFYKKVDGKLKRVSFWFVQKLIKSGQPVIIATYYV